MSEQSLPSSNWDDIVFENRNKEYGAYLIRKVYSTHVLIALIISVAVLGIVLSYPAIVDFFFHQEAVSDAPLKTVRYTDLAPPPPINKNTPPPPKLDIPQVKKIIKFLPPKVTEKEVIEEEEMPTIEEIRHNETGAEEIEGTGEVIFDEPVQEIVDDGAGENEIFLVVEQAPEFEGGLAAMYKFIQKNMNYPAKARRMGIEGSVFVGFVVERDGTIADVQIIKGIDVDCDKEAVRVVSKMPPWKPGKQSGRPVRVRFVLPIKFRLDS
jgi:protein TonB